MPLALSVTNFGDLAATVSLAALVLVWFVAVGARRTAFAWAAGFCVVGALVAAQKIGARACDLTWPDLGILSVSGHTAMSTVVYGVVAIVLAGRSAPMLRPLVLMAAAVLVGAIAWSRVELHAHSASEVAVGLALGLTGIGLVVLLGRPAERGPVGRGALAMLCALLLLLVYGQTLNAEARVTQLADELRASYGLCANSMAHAPQ